MSLLIEIKRATLEKFVYVLISIMCNVLLSYEANNLFPHLIIL